MTLPPTPTDYPSDFNFSLTPSYLHSLCPPPPPPPMSSNCFPPSYAILLKHLSGPAVTSLLRKETFSISQNILQDWIKKAGMKHIFSCDLIVFSFIRVSLPSPVCGGPAWLRRVPVAWQTASCAHYLKHVWLGRARLGGEMNKAS